MRKWSTFLVLALALALCASACAALWGFKDLGGGDDASVEPDGEVPPGNSTDGSVPPDAGEAAARSLPEACANLCDAQCSDPMTDPDNCGATEAAVYPYKYALRGKAERVPFWAILCRQDDPGSKPRRPIW